MTAISTEDDEMISTEDLEQLLEHEGSYVLYALADILEKLANTCKGGSYEKYYRALQHDAMVLAMALRGLEEMS